MGHSVIQASWFLVIAVQRSASGLNMIVRTFVIALAATSFVTAAMAEAPATGARVEGYLDKGAVNAARIIAAPPVDDDPYDVADWAAYRSTRTLVVTPRYELATTDVDEAWPVVVDGFSCALGARVTPEAAPHLFSLLARAKVDLGAASNGAKDIYKRHRPSFGNVLPVCEPRNGKSEAGWGYPSGHTTRGWAVGLFLTELAPDRATEVMSRARAYGDSRVVCGSHFPSDVEGGRMVASTVVAMLHANQQFVADLAAARVELAAIRKAAAPLDAAQCKVVDEASARRPW